MAKGSARSRSQPRCRSESLTIVSLLLAVLALPALRGLAAESEPRSLESPWGDWVEADFPFFSSVLDARRTSDGRLQDNLTARALILNLGQGMWAAFDIDLLRIAAIWEGAGVTPAASAPRTYHRPFVGPRGRRGFPIPDGKVWLANGIYPGWQTASRFSGADPRQPQPSPKEVGRGPLPVELGRFDQLRLQPDGVRLDYRVGDVRVQECVRVLSSGGVPAVGRWFRVRPASRPLLLVVGAPWEPAESSPDVRIFDGTMEGRLQLQREEGFWTVAVPPHAETVEFVVLIARGTAVANRPVAPSFAGFDEISFNRWPTEIVTRGELAPDTTSHVLDRIPLPHENPWRRHVRLGDVQFFSDGRAAGVTVDGDVWHIDGLAGDLGTVRWHRFASGLHEPISLAIRNGEVFVFDRGGIWNLRDTNGDGEADEYRMFCHLFTQTAEDSELPNAIKVAPDGTFLVSKGGQRRRTLSRHSGTILRVSPDGAAFSVLGHGFRQPFAGVDPRDGKVTAADQEGYNVPATPLYLVEDNRFHGYPYLEVEDVFLAKAHLPTEYPADMAKAVLWLPRSVNASGICQIWMTDKRMGQLYDTLIYVGYKPRSLTIVRFGERAGRRRAFGTSLTRDLPFPPLSGSVNPRDGQLYVAGFKLNNDLRHSDGLARIRSTGAPFLQPLMVTATDQGLLRRFAVPLDVERARDPDRFAVARWNYQRTPNYGSPHYRLDGSMGQETMTPSSAYLSKDGMSVLVGVPDMRADVMQMQVRWKLVSRTGRMMEGEAHLTVKDLVHCEPGRERFGDITVDLTPREVVRPPEEVPVSVLAGRRLARSIGCCACHSINGTMGLGPTWKDLAGSLRTLKNGDVVVADDAYLRESILNAGAKVVAGYTEGMPSFAGIMGEAQVESLILYINSLR